jgi:hypothetical protein
LQLSIRSSANRLYVLLEALTGQATNLEIFQEIFHVCTGGTTPGLKKNQTADQPSLSSVDFLCDFANYAARAFLPLNSSIPPGRDCLLPTLPPLFLDLINLFSITYRILALQIFPNKGLGFQIFLSKGLSGTPWNGYTPSRYFGPACFIVRQDQKIDRKLRFVAGL